MTDVAAPPVIQPQGPDAAGVVSWVHIGDLHMKQPGEQNHIDLQSIVARINDIYSQSIAFVYLPGDIADDGSHHAYTLVRAALGQLHVPWCAILGDHDVHEGSFKNFVSAMSRDRYYSFSAGETFFAALNAFDEPHPASFVIFPKQLAWLQRELEGASRRNQQKILLMHCYPTDLKTGGQPLRSLIGHFAVRLVDMGHTHYNEIANDGCTLYTATRSTGQIEEGPVGFSVTNLDAGVVSWRFVELSKQATVMITSPGDERLLSDAERARPIEGGRLRVRAKVWGIQDPQRVCATLAGSEADMNRIENTQVWEGVLQYQESLLGRHALAVRAQDKDGTTVNDEIFIYLGPAPSISRLRRDQDNALAAWPGHGLLGTQLGPNKNGRKW